MCISHSASRVLRVQHLPSQTSYQFCAPCWFSPWRLFECCDLAQTDFVLLLQSCTVAMDVFRECHEYDFQRLLKVNDKLLKWGHVGRDSPSLKYLNYLVGLMSVMSYKYCHNESKYIYTWKTSLMTALLWWKFYSFSWLPQHGCPYNLENLEPLKLWGVRTTSCLGGLKIMFFFNHSQKLFCSPHLDQRMPNQWYFMMCLNLKRILNNDQPTWVHHRYKCVSYTCTYT